MARETRWKLTCSRLAEAQRPICRGAIKGFSFSDHPGPTLPQLTRLLLANPGERPLSGCWPFWLLACLVTGLSGYWPVWLLAMCPSHANKAAAGFATPPRSYLPAWAPESLLTDLALHPGLAPLPGQ